MHRIITAAAVLAAFAGCASTPESNTSVTSSSPAASSGTRAHAPAVPAAPKSASNANASGSALGNVAAPAKRSVYFDYDSNVVKDEYVPIVTSNAQYLAKRNAPFRVEGNTDERGSREYNLALGQRRADAVKQRLTLLGVPAAEIETVSFGEEKPRANGETEQALAENRRADIVYGR